jgi:hypothetical protein
LSWFVPVSTFLVLPSGDPSPGERDTDDVSFCGCRLLPPIPRQLVMSLLWSSTNLRAKDLKVLIKQSAHAPNAEYVRTAFISLHVYAEPVVRTN